MTYRTLKVHMMLFISKYNSFSWFYYVRYNNSEPDHGYINVKTWGLLFLFMGLRSKVEWTCMSNTDLPRLMTPLWTFNCTTIWLWSNRNTGIIFLEHQWIARANSPRETLLWSTRFSNGTNSPSYTLLYRQKFWRVWCMPALDEHQICFYMSQVFWLCRWSKHHLEAN